eukprot:g18841.t1
MVDYSKWDNLDSDSDSDGGSANPSVAHRKQAACTPSADNKRVMDQAEALRLQGNSAYERGDVSQAIGAYDAQLRVLEGRKDEASVEMICGALLNQASGFIRLKKFAEAEARCTRVLACTTPSDGVKIAGGATARARALHFRGFARLQQGLFEGACSDLKSSLAAGSSSGDEARALLLEAEAGAAMASCPDPEAKGRELLRQGQGREAAQHFRDAASRARRRKETADGHNKSPRTGGADGGSGGGDGVAVALARNLRMEGVAVAMAGDRPTAELLLRAALREVPRGGGGGDGSTTGSSAGGGGAEEEKGFALAALGSLLAQEGKHAKAVETLREAVSALDGAIAVASAHEDGVVDSNDGGSSQPSSPAAKARITALTRTLTGTLAFLGTSIVALEANTGANDSGTTGSPTKAGEGKGTDTATDTTTNAAVAAPEAGGSPEVDDDEGVRVLKRSHEILKVEMAAIAATKPDQENGSAVTNLTGGESRGVEEVGKQTAKVLDTLSEAYAGKRRWELARSAAEQSLTAWRSLGDAGRAGAAASLLSLGHLVLQLHGVGAGIEEASARWEEAAMCFNDCAERPSVAAEVRLKIAGFYTKVVRSDPSRLESLEGKIAAHYAEAAALFARERDEKTSALKRSAAAVAAAEAPRNTVVGSAGNSNTLPPLPPSVVDSLEPDGRSRWELAEKEASAWEGYAGAVGDDHEAAAKALRKAEGLLDHASVSEKDESWILRKVGVLHGLALALAQGGEHAMAEDKLVQAIRQLQELDGVNADADDCAHKKTLTDLFKYLAIARRARGDLPGAKEALGKVESLGGGKGREDVEGLDRLMTANKIAVE